MHPKTIAFLNELAAVKWFANVGKPDTSANSAGTVFVSSWDDAVKYCTAQIYDDASLEASNQIGVHLQPHHKDEYQLWNNKIAEIKLRAEPLINKKRNEAIKENRAPKNLSIDPLNWDVVGICVALEYSDLYESEYYKKL